MRLLVLPEVISGISGEIPQKRVPVLFVGAKPKCDFSPIRAATDNGFAVKEDMPGAVGRAVILVGHEPFVRDFGHRCLTGQHD